MKICQNHWDKLKELIEAEGLSRFIAKDGVEAMNNAIKEIEDKPTPQDPLMMCNNMIWSRSIEVFGLGIMQEDCPCCYANNPNNYPFFEDKEPTGDWWIRTLVPHVKKMFIEKGLLNIN